MNVLKNKMINFNLRPCNLVCPISYALMTDPVVAADGRASHWSIVQRNLSRFCH